ncbi:protein rolling stone-like [Haliotis rufescens]|uniref:protein rolling stone-like n=1 Tax=Haliotis rufescens TaxID=6454 RepID=UPI00201F934D|nr:protein rolling stone-like [Haliotis rufescens]XP_046371835.2 protein rolling stone-like [Haliotis rufescens]
MSCPRRSCLALREEFRLKRFGFGDVYRGRFFMWQWRIPPILYLLYRLVLAVYVDVWLIYLTAGSGSMDLPNGLSMAAFLTIWTYTVLALYMTTNFVAAFFNYFCLRRQDTHFMRRPPSEGHQNMFPEISTDPWMVSSGYEAVPDSDEEVDIRLYRLPWYLKIVWILFNVVSSSSVMVTIIFFAVLFPEMTGAKVGSMDNVQLHMLNSVIVVVEHLVSAIPIRLLHVIYPITYGLVYVFFSLFYWIPDHNHVMYPKVLDWNQPGLTIGMICLIGFVIIPVLHSVFYLIYQLKMAIYKRLV